MNYIPPEEEIPPVEAIPIAEVISSDVTENIDIIVIPNEDVQLINVSNNTQEISPINAPINTTVSHVSPKAIQLSRHVPRVNSNEINWEYLSRHVPRVNSNEINWEYLSKNPSPKAIQLLSENHHK